MIRYLAIIGLVAVFLSGCSPERKLAREYVRKHSGNGIMIVPLFELYKDNLSISYDTSFQFSTDQLDSIAWEQSCYIKLVSDSVFLTTFTNNLIDELSVSGYDVYVDESSDVFLSLPDPKWVVQVAQLQLDESHRIEDQMMYSIETGEPYSDGFRINQLNLSSWFDVSRANSGNKQVLFLDGFIQDDFKLKLDLDIMGGSMGMTGKRDSLEINDVYRMAGESGKKHAELLYDYFLNEYIREHLPASIVNREYYHYDRKSNKLKRGLHERFDVLD